MQELVSKRGIVLIYIDRGSIVCDGNAWFVDDLCNCCDQWDGTGSFREFCIRMFQRELDSVNAWLLKTNGLENDVIKTTVEIQKALLSSIESESEPGLLAFRSCYVTNPKRAIELVFDTIEKRRKVEEQRLLVVSLQ